MNGNFIISSLLKKSSSYNSGAIKENKQEDYRIKKLKEYLHDHIADKILLKDLSAVAFLSPFHLLRQFKKSVGLTPNEYLINLRVEKAKQLLKSKKTLSDIVELTGFTDQSHLTKTFRKHLS